jgi:hypothetical protein
MTREGRIVGISEAPLQLGSGFLQKGHGDGGQMTFTDTRTMNRPDRFLVDQCQIPILSFLA